MPFYRVGTTTVHVKLSGKAKAKAPAPCCARIPSFEGGKPEVRCMAMSAYLCDAIVDGGTCDAPLCVDHAQAVAADRHLCPVHAAQGARATPAEAQQSELF